MKQLWLKIFALALALTMLLSVTSCAPAGGPFGATDDSTGNAAKEETTAEETTTESPDGETTETADLTTETEATNVLSVPEKLNFKTEVSVLYWSDAEATEFSVEDISGNTLDDEVYWRNRHTSDYLGVTLKWMPMLANAENADRFVSAVQASYEASNRVYDMIASHPNSMAALSQKGLLADLSEIDNSYLNLTKAWWPTSIAENLSYKDALYFLTGSISTNALYAMNVVLCNETMLQTLNAENPMALVEKGEWTLSKFIEMASIGYADTDADGTKSKGDTFGFFCSDTQSLGQYYLGAGLLQVEKDENDLPVISGDCDAEKAANLLNTLRGFLAAENSFVYSDASMQECVDGRAFFAESDLHTWGKIVYTVETDYYLLPTPKYDESQKNYVTTLSRAFTLWGVMADATGEEQSVCSAVLETLAYYAKGTTAAVFEIVSRGCYCDCEENRLKGVMFNLLCDGITVDLARVFLPEGDVIDTFAALTVDGSGVITPAVLTTYKKALQERLAEKT